MINDNYSTLIVGHQKCGKTFKAEQIAKTYPGRVLAVSPDDRETIFQRYPYITDPGNSKIKRLIFEKRYCTSFENFTNGLLIFDDCRRYVRKYEDSFAGVINRKRHFNRDILFICHSVWEFPPSLVQFINGIYIFPFFDAENRIEGRLHDTPGFMEVWRRVNKTRVPEYFHIFD